MPQTRTPKTLPPPFTFETPLNSQEETQFQAWKSKYAPYDTGIDYDLRGAFKEGLKPNPNSGHWPDTYKKPNHPSFSNESKYATPDAPHWNDQDQLIDKSGRVVFDEKTQGRAPLTAPPSMPASIAHDASIDRIHKGITGSGWAGLKNQLADAGDLVGFGNSEIEDLNAGTGKPVYGASQDVRKIGEMVDGPDNKVVPFKKPLPNNIPNLMTHMKQFSSKASELGYENMGDFRQGILDDNNWEWLHKENPITGTSSPMTPELTEVGEQYRKLHKQRETLRKLGIAEPSPLPKHPEFLSYIDNPNLIKDPTTKEQFNKLLEEEKLNDAGLSAMLSQGDVLPSEANPTLTEHIEKLHGTRKKMVKLIDDYHNHPEKREPRILKFPIPLPPKKE